MKNFDKRGWAVKKNRRHVRGSRRICVGEVMDMVGWLALRRERGRLRAEEELIGSMRVIRAVVYEPEGLAPWRLRLRLRRPWPGRGRAG